MFEQNPGETVLILSSITFSDELAFKLFLCSFSFSQKVSKFGDFFLRIKQRNWHAEFKPPSASRKAQGWEAVKFWAWAPTEALHRRGRMKRVFKTTWRQPPRRKRVTYRKKVISRHLHYATPPPASLGWLLPCLPEFIDCLSLPFNPSFFLLLDGSPDTGDCRLPA